MNVFFVFFKLIKSFKRQSMKFCKIPSLGIKWIVAQDIEISDPNKSLNNLFLFSLFGDYREFIFWFQKHSDPVGDISFQSHPETSFNQAIFNYMSCIDYVFLFLDHLFKILHWKWLFTFLKNLFISFFTTLLI